MRFFVLEFLLVDEHLLANRDSSDHKITEKGKMCLLANMELHGMIVDG